MIKSAIPAVGISNRWTYNNAGALLSYIDGENKTWKYTASMRGQTTSSVSPLGIIQTYQYDATNNLTKKSLKESNGTILSATFGYNTLDLMTQVISPGSSSSQTRTQNMTWTPHHLVQSITSPLGRTVTNQYDNLDRLVKQTV